MYEYVNENLAAPEPLTPLHAGEACRYVRCNLTNRRVHPASVVTNCQVSQIVFDGEGETATAHHVGRGVLGEVTAAAVHAVRDAIGGGA